MKKGRKISEDEIPPPVALGRRPLAPQEATDRSPEAEPPAAPSVEPGIWRQSDPVLVPKVRAWGLPPHPAIVRGHVSDRVSDMWLCQSQPP